MRWAVIWTILLGLLLLPFLLFEEKFVQLGSRLAAGSVRGWALAGAISALLALDVFLPVPSSIVSTAAGALLGFWRGTMVVWAGMTIGCVVGYGIGTRGAVAARRWVGEASLLRAAALMERHGAWTLALCRAVPVLAEASVVFGGLVRAPMPRFLAVTTASNLGIAIAYATLGACSMQRQSFLLVFAGAVALPGIVLLGSRVMTHSPRGQAQ